MSGFDGSYSMVERSVVGVRASEPPMVMAFFESMFTPPFPRYDRRASQAYIHLLPMSYAVSSHVDGPKAMSKATSYSMSIEPMSSVPALRDVEVVEYLHVDVRPM